MRPKDPLPLYHSWPLYARDERCGLGAILGRDAPAGLDALTPDDEHELALHGIGLWHCALPDNRLHWGAGVHDLFGLPRDAAPTRDEAASCYCPESRAVMENLRAYAIRHRRGFTVNVELHRFLSRRRWIELTAFPVCQGMRVVGLRGIKRGL